MDSLPIINKSYELYKNILTINTKLEKRWRYGLALNLENSLMECIEILIMAKNAPKTLKSAYLIKAVSKLESTSLKLRLYLELDLTNETVVFQLQHKVAEIGRMLGGWLKSTNGI